MTEPGHIVDSRHRGIDVHDGDEASLDEIEVMGELVVGNIVVVVEVDNIVVGVDDNIEVVDVGLFELGGFELSGLCSLAVLLFSPKEVVFSIR